MEIYAHTKADNFSNTFFSVMRKHNNFKYSMMFTAF